MTISSDLLRKIFEHYALKCPPTFKIVGDKCVKKTAKEVLTSRSKCSKPNTTRELRNKSK